VNDGWTKGTGWTITTGMLAFLNAARLAEWFREHITGRALHEGIFRGVSCDHRRMRECCGGVCGSGCGHYYCPRCGLEWDDGCDFPLEEMAGPTKEDFE